MTWPSCECGCGEPVATDPRSGRPTRFAGPKCSRRAHRRRARKAQLAKKKRRCLTCGLLKVPTVFDGPTARRCNTCKHKIAIACCGVCGEIVGESAHGGERKVCDRPECRTAYFSRLREAQLAREAKKHAARKTKRCPGCGVKKRLTREFWALAGVRFDGSIRWDSVCKLCKAATARERNRSDPEFRVRRLASLARSREKMRERRRADPAYNEEYLRRHREWARQARERRALNGDASPEEPKVPGAGGRNLPALPLAEFIDHEASRQKERLNGHAPDHDKMLESVCLKLGVASRRVNEWRRVPGAQVRTDVVDRVLINAGLLWFDIYDPVRFPREHEAAARAFA